MDQLPGLSGGAGDRIRPLFPKERGVERSDISEDTFFSVAAGSSLQLWRADATALHPMVDGSTASFLDTHLQQARFAPQLSHDFPLEAGLLGSSLDPALLTSATEPTGVLNWLPTNHRISASPSARILLQPRQQGEGLSLSLQPSFGTTTSRLEQLLAATSFIAAQDWAFANSPPTPEFRAQVAYGLLNSNDSLLIPYIDASLSYNSNTSNTGLRHALATGMDPDLSASHRQRSNGNHDNRFFLQLRSESSARRGVRRTSGRGAWPIGVSHHTRLHLHPHWLVLQ